MSRFSRLGRLAAATVLVASGATVALTSTAGAANTPLAVDCSISNLNQTIANSDTLTITLQVPSCAGFVVFNNPPSGPAGTATFNGSPLTAGSPMGFSGGDTIVYTAPASGSGTDGFVILPSLTPPITPLAMINITFPVPTPRTGDSMVDNGNGSMTVTLAPLTNSQTVFINFFPSGTTCPSSGSASGRLFLLTSSSLVTAPLTSGAVISAGSSVYTISNNTPVPTTIPAGSYQACMNFNSGNGPSVLEQSLAITLGEVTPDPVAPAFTG